ncbi:MAG: SCP2 sterol-binding domain-containing protein [Pseudomonadota bacterium]
MNELAELLSTKAMATPVGPILVHFDLSPDGSLFLDTRSGEVKLSSECSEKPETTMTLSAANFKEMLKGALDPTKAFMGGKMQVDGNMQIAMKLATVISK